jgi:preprotein translocase subunit SecE
MKKIQSSKSGWYEYIALFAVSLITVAAFIGTYSFHFSAPVKVMIWIGWLVCVLAFGFFTSQGQQVYFFSKEAKIELEKVVWPSRQEAIQTTSIVMIMVTVTGFVLWGIDSGMTWAIAKITHLG